MFDSISQTMSRPMSEAARNRLGAFAPNEAGRDVLYLSTPITTGPRLLAWLADQAGSGSGGVESSARDIVLRQVIRENLANLAPLRERVRAEHDGVHVIDPTTLEVPGWSQWEYHRFWVEVIECLVDRIVFADGWELSTGCTIEYAAGLELGIPMETADGKSLTPLVAARMLRNAAATLAAAGRDTTVTLDAVARAEYEGLSALKDAQLLRLSKSYNVASFASFAPGLPRLRFQVIPGGATSRSVGVRKAVERLLRASAGGSVNIRTFRREPSKGNPFHYGLRTVNEVLELLDQFAKDGYYSIVNETIDTHDGGISGVILGGVAEFAPDDTPRAVETSGVARLHIEQAQDVLGRVYGEAVVLPNEISTRIEFSVHPNRVGHRREPVLVWESEYVGDVRLDAVPDWPNRFSRHIGDKTYGLLIADSLGLPVPAATVIARRVAPFNFGRPTGTGDWWMRTAPARQNPGHFTTTRGWIDPFKLLAKEDPDGSIAAVIAQEGVDAVFSGATLPLADGSGHVVEGVRGVGDSFMLGEEATIELPAEVESQVLTLLGMIEDKLGPGVRIEWAADSQCVWVLQLHRVTGGVATGVFSPGDPKTWLSFDPDSGLEALTELIAEAKEVGAGVEVIKAVGLTSHVGDLLRRARVPGRLAADVQRRSDG